VARDQAADFLNQAFQRQAHRLVKMGGGEVGAAELQLGDEARKKYAALLYREAVGSCPDSVLSRRSVTLHRRHGFPIKPRVHVLSPLEVGNSFLCDRDGNTRTGIAALTCSSVLN
jgi:hypothetical protein